MGLITSISKGEQEMDYTCHIKQENECVPSEPIVEKKEREIEADEKKKLTNIFMRCLDILRDSEDITGKNALLNFTYILTLYLIEPMVGNEIDLDNYKHVADLALGLNSPGEFLPRGTRLNRDMRRSEVDNLAATLDNLWSIILSQHPQTMNIFNKDRRFAIKKSTTFKTIFDELTKIDISTLDTDTIGNVFENLIEYFATNVVKEIGQPSEAGYDLNSPQGEFLHREAGLALEPIQITPSNIREMMIDLIQPDFRKNETLFDPAMGTGGFLVSYIKRLKSQARSQNVDLDWKMVSKNIGGREIDIDVFSLANSNILITTGKPCFFPCLENGDSIRNPIENRYDIVLANTAFGIKGVKYDEITSPLRDEYLPIKSDSGVALFLQAIISMLKVGGRCAMIVPDENKIFGNSKELLALREYFMKTCELREVYKLPSGVFPNASIKNSLKKSNKTSIKTCILYFYKRKEGKDVIKIGKRNRTRTYKFVEECSTNKVKYYDCNLNSNLSKFVMEVDIKRIQLEKYLF
jgi:type I restriction-modification system DNA methylase subunit